MADPLIEFDRVTVLRNGLPALDRLDLRIEDGERVAVLGPNGAGKSTLVDALTRAVYPALGLGPTALRIYGRDRWDVFELRSLLGIVTHTLVRDCTGPHTALETVLSGFFGSVGIWPHHEVTAAMRESARAALRSLDIAHLEDERVDRMSSGEVRRAVIARALVHQPRALVLDEPTVSLDIRGRRELLTAMRGLVRDGRSLVLVTHTLDDIIPEIDRVVTLRDGRILHDGPTREVLRSGPLSEVFGVDVHVAEREGVWQMW
ncbi:MAG TPA: ATP-binding cassette domain-containing protein [Myxococcales bacterium]|nr:ATP-binding cassette domain-containing protein [Myxococcales bacterium]